MTDRNNKLGNWAGGLGFSSILLWEWSIFPILAIILGSVAVYKGRQQNKEIGLAIWGIVLGAVFLLVRLHSVQG